MSSFITTDATQEVFELVLARPVVSESGEHPWMVHLWWRAPLQGDRVVQVYVQDELYDVVLDPAARETYLVLDRTSANRIELLAVPSDDPEVVWRSQPALLGSWQTGVSNAVKIGLVRDESLPPDTHVVVEVDGAVADVGAMWPREVNRSDPGGVVDHSEVAGLGLGIGELGVGRLGSDGNAMYWRRHDLPLGAHDVQLKAVNTAGQTEALALLLEEVPVDGLPEPVAGLSVDSGFGLSWTLPGT